MSIYEIIINYWSGYLFFASVFVLAFADEMDDWDGFIGALIVASIWPVWALVKIFQKLAK